MRTIIGAVLGVVVTATAMCASAVPARAGQGANAPALKRAMTILQDASLGTTTLSQGKYDAEISGGDDAVLVVRRDKTEVARSRVRRTALASPSKYDRVDVRTDGDHKIIVAIFFKGDPRVFEIVDDQGVAAAQKP